MNECGQIVQVDNGNATIKVKRSSTCASCGACGMGAHQEDMLLTIPNRLGGRVGDYAELELSSKQLIKASAITYIVPLSALIVGVTGGYILGPMIGLDPELTGSIAGLTLTVLSFLGIRLLEPRFKRGHNFSPQMVKIIDMETKGEDLDGKQQSVRA
ncbi:MAG TPA: SoxR reducing system RseC family protein [Bacillota bacterium]|nr:SoxR reducing system RseC family protein [Bacillota bacterium]